MAIRVLILGGNGLLGHKLWQVCRERFATWITIRSSCSDYAIYNLFDPDRTVGGVDVFACDSVRRALESVRPDVVVNSIGIIERSPASRDAVAALMVNSVFPHRLAVLCRDSGARLIHISTDCVFSGRQGMYTEDALPDPEDFYGRCKLVGELTYPFCLTLRTSIIGRAIRNGRGLVEWFLGHRGKRVRGYTHSIYTGFSTLVLAQIIADLIENHSGLTGIYHVSSEPISKYELLCLLQRFYGAEVEVEAYPDVRVDRSLNSDRFRRRTGFVPQPWPEMVQAMATDPTPYETWRRSE